jgi:Mn2+/Fe2+ NRAMP family transporter
MKNVFKLGPATLITAAFIGPGTVTICAKAGIEFGFSLLWALLLSIIIAISFQEMSARIGIVTGKGLAQLMRTAVKNPLLKSLVTLLILSAIVIGNTAYEAGNLNGAVLGLEALFTDEYSSFYPWIIGIITALLLRFGSMKYIKNILIGLVLFMSISFLLTAIITAPNLLELIKGMVSFELNSSNVFTAIALVGTTVVPYNLFLHAAMAKDHWKDPKDLKYARLDTFVAIGLGGIISISIIIAASAIDASSLNSVIDIAAGLEPLYGKFAKTMIGLGLFAAGISSALTAPIAAAYVANSCFDWNLSPSDSKFKNTALVILLLGMISLGFGFSPIIIIQFAQITNGILLPILALFILWLVNNRALLKENKNGIVQNILGILIVIISLLMSFKTLSSIF